VRTMMSSTRVKARGVRRLRESRGTAGEGVGEEGVEVDLVGDIRGKIMLHRHGSICPYRVKGGGTRYLF
jgi:hypothetical protein